MTLQCHPAEELPDQTPSFDGEAVAISKRPSDAKRSRPYDVASTSGRLGSPQFAGNEMTLCGSSESFAPIVPAILALTSKATSSTRCISAMTTPSSSMRGVLMGRQLRSAKLPCRSRIS